MKKTVGVLIAAVLVIILLVTCPDASSHKEAVTQAINDYAVEKIDAVEGGSPATHFFTSAIASKIIPLLVNSRVSVSNYFIFSVGRANIKGEGERIVSLGLLGHVFTFDKDDIGEIMDMSASGSDSIGAAE